MISMQSQKMKTGFTIRVYVNAQYSLDTVNPLEYVGPINAYVT